MGAGQSHALEQKLESASLRSGLDTVNRETEPPTIRASSWNFPVYSRESIMTASCRTMIETLGEGIVTLLKAQSDADLLRLMMAGDEGAFTELYRRRQGAVYQFALQMSGSPALAEDVTQEVFMALMRDGHRFDEARGSLSTYLYGIARNHVLRRWERDRRHEPISDETRESETINEAMIAESDPLAEVTRNEEIESLRRTVLALPAHYREVVVLCELHELSYAEAAQALGCAVGTVRSRLHRARAMLIERLSGRSRNKQNEDETEADEPTSAVANGARCLA